MTKTAAPYHSPPWRRATGGALRPGGLALTQRALAVGGFARGDKILDLGCGPGQTVRHLAAELGLGAIGLDLDWQMLAEARAAGPDIPWLQAEAGTIPLKNGSLDGVLMECVLSLVADPAGVLAECRRVLSPGGRLMVSDLYLRQPPEGGESPAWPGCLGGARSREAWQALVLEAGFELLVWEDQSPFLRELTARLVWEHGSAAAFWEAWCGGPDCGEAAAQASLARPGYFLLVARQKEDGRG